MLQPAWKSFKISYSSYTVLTHFTLKNLKYSLLHLNSKNSSRDICAICNKKEFSPQTLIMFSILAFSIHWVSLICQIKKKKFIFSFESSLPLLKYKCLKTVLCSFFLYLQYSLEQRSPTFWHQGPVCERVFPGMLRGDGFGMVLIRSAKPRSLACTVHSRIHPPMRIECYRWFFRRQSSGGDGSDGEWL